MSKEDKSPGKTQESSAEDKPKKRRITQQPARAHRATKPGPPLEHLRQKAQNANVGGDPPPIPRRQTPVHHEAEAVPPSPQSEPQDQASKPPTSGDKSSNNRTTLIIASIVGLLAVGSCCAATGIIALWLSIA